MATQQAQIEVLLAQNRSLESKLAKASQSVHNSTQQPQPPAAAKRKATTSTETLQSEEDMTARIIEMVNASVAEALRTTVQTTVVNAVRAAVTEAFATVDSRLTNIETRFSNMEATVNNTVAGLEALRTATDTSFAVIKQSMARAPAITRNRLTSHSSTQHSEPTTASTSCLPSESKALHVNQARENDSWLPIKARHSPLRGATRSLSTALRSWRCGCTQSSNAVSPDASACVCTPRVVAAAKPIPRRVGSKRREGKTKRGTRRLRGRPVVYLRKRAAGSRVKLFPGGRADDFESLVGPSSVCFNRTAGVTMPRLQIT
ncbi:hypothetical protein MRX96_032590 [Rhipicephalus microplus]